MNYTETELESKMLFYLERTEKVSGKKGHHK